MAHIESSGNFLDRKAVAREGCCTIRARRFLFRSTYDIMTEGAGRFTVIRGDFSETARLLDSENTIALLKKAARKIGDGSRIGPAYMTNGERRALHLLAEKELSISELSSGLALGVAGTRVLVLGLVNDGLAVREVGGNGTRKVFITSKGKEFLSLP
jgi:hypothetical protein